MTGNYRRMLFLSITFDMLLPKLTPHVDLSIVGHECGPMSY